MGFLVESTPLSWEQALPKLKYVRDHGIEQFINVFFEAKGIKGDLLKYGDEVEYQLVKLDGHESDPKRRPKISLRSPEVVQCLHLIEAHGRSHGLSEADMCAWMPEYGRWMLEGTPGKPFEGITALTKVEDNMRLRRSRLLAHLLPDEISPTLACFPLLGVGEFWHCPDPVEVLTTGGPVARSKYVPDEVTFPHQRFKTLTQNIRERRGERVRIERPKFVDEKTDLSRPKIDADAMCFGMGCSALQVTFQAANLGESRHLYDHLAVLTPIMMALTAATPYLRGWLQAEDVRWSIVAESVDDRTAAERGVEQNSIGDPRLAGNGVKRLRKARYGGIDCYISPYTGTYEQAATEMAEAHNDFPMQFEQHHFDRLALAGIDTVLARHVAHLFCRDPLVIFEDRIQLNDRADVDHWENIQSTNWQSVRWKPPHPERGKLDVSSERHIGWRVEFRSMELQMTDFENAAFTVFVVLISRVLLTLELNLYVPISKLEENMRTAHKMNAVTEAEFWFRKNLLPNSLVRQIDAKVNKRANNIKSSCNNEVGQTRSTSHGTGSSSSLSSEIGAASNTAKNDNAASTRAATDMNTSFNPISEDDEEGVDQMFRENIDIPDAELYEKMTIREILLGKDCAASKESGVKSSSSSPNLCGGQGLPGTSTSSSGCHFPGLIPLCRIYLDFIGVDSVTAQKINKYLDFIVARAKGDLPTNAQWIREFIRNHKSYKQDSRVPPDTAYDLLMKAKRIGEGEEQCKELLGDFFVDRCYPASNPFVFDQAADPISKRSVTSSMLDKFFATSPGPQQRSTNVGDGTAAAAAEPRDHEVVEITMETEVEELRNDLRRASPGGPMSPTIGPASSVTTSNLSTSTSGGPTGTRRLSPGGPGAPAAPDNFAPSGRTVDTSITFASPATLPKPSCNEPCSTTNFVEARKRDMLEGYLQRAKIRRDHALRHALRKKREKMQQYASEVEALQRDIRTSEGVAASALPKGLSANMLVEASTDFSNRQSYRISMSPSALSRAVSQEAPRDRH